MSQIIAVANQKGGVAKTTSAFNVAGALAEQAKRVLLIDLDPSGGLTKSTSIDRASLTTTVYDVIIKPAVPLTAAIVSIKPNIDLVPALRDLSGAEVELISVLNRERALARKLESVRDQYDFVIIDCGPDLGLLTINALTAAESVLIPCETQFLAIAVLPELMQTIEQVRAYTNPALRIIGILPTKYDSRTLHHREALEELRTTYNGMVLSPPIAARVGVADAIIGGKTILEYDSRSDAAQQYRRVAEVILNG